LRRSSHKPAPLIVASFEAAVDHFRLGALEHLTFLSGREIEEWARRTAQAYIDRGEVVVCTPLAHLTWDMLLAMASQELLEYMERGERGAGDAFFALFHLMRSARREPNAQQLWEQALDEAINFLPYPYSDEAKSCLAQVLSYCAAVATIDKVRQFGKARSA
jgi:hypothetical protein